MARGGGSVVGNRWGIHWKRLGIWSYSWGSQLLYCKHHWPNPYCTWESLAFFFFLMALLITQDEYLVPLNNRQYCMSVLRGKGQTISLLVYTKWYVPFFPTRASYWFGLEGKGYKDFRIAGIKGLSKTAQQYCVLLGMFLCQKKITQFICCSCLYS